MTYIPLKSVTSSMISQVGYDHKKQTLRVLFHNGDAYDYPMFTPRDWSAFQEAESLGKHFHRTIKPVFAHRRVEARELEEPCCDHPNRDTCDDSCLPCDPACCSGVSEAQHKARLAALAAGLQRGDQLITAARTQGAGNPITGVDDGVSLSPLVVDEKKCEHPNKEASSDGSIVGCAACGADLSPGLVQTEPVHKKPVSKEGDYDGAKN